MCRVGMIGDLRLGRVQVSYQAKKAEEDRLRSGFASLPVSFPFCYSFLGDQA